MTNSVSCNIIRTPTT